MSVVETIEQNSQKKLAEIRAVKTSAGWANPGKVHNAQKIDYFVHDLKNKMSKYIHDNFQALIDDKKEFVTRYAQFACKEKEVKYRIIFAWETQTLFTDICTTYENILEQFKEKIDTSIQDKIKFEYYKRGVTLASGEIKKKGDIKDVSVIKKKTELSRIVKILALLDTNNLEKYKGEDIYDKIICVWMHHKHWSKILHTAKQIRMHMMLKIPVAKFTTGTYRINLKGYEFIEDVTNKKFRYWFRYDGKWYPLQMNEKYHDRFRNIKKEENKQVFVKVVGNRVDFIFVTDRELKFKNFTKSLGLDINIKNNFCTSSDLHLFDYDRKYINEFIEEIKKVDAIGYRNLNDLQKANLEKIILRNEFYFKERISEILHQFAAEGYSDIVLENLTNFDKGKFNIKNDEFQMSYTRLTRLLRLGNIKKWFKEQGEKLGIRVHITHAPYSSQKCQKCHNIDRANRPTQEKFKCTDCEFEAVADFNSPVNLNNNLLSDVLRAKLHTFDQYGRAVPKNLSRQQIKKILSSLRTSRLPAGHLLETKLLTV